MALGLSERFGMQRSGGIEMFRGVGGCGHRWSRSLTSFRGAQSADLRCAIARRGISRFRVQSCGLPRNDGELSIHPEKIPFPDFHAVVAQDAVRGGGVEVEIREREIIEELLSLERHGVGRADRKSNVAAIGAVELRRLERLD